MTSNNSKRCTLTAMLLASAAVGLFLAPSWLSDTIRLGVRDAAQPGGALLLATGESMQLTAANLIDRPDSTHEEQKEQLVQLRSDTAELKLALRRSQIASALVSEKLDRLQREGHSPYRITPGRPLIIPRLLEATVMSTHSTAKLRSNRLIDQGTAGGLTDSDLVLENVPSFIDQGADEGLSADLPVFAGRSVVGKTAEVGRVTSSILLVTDAGYRGAAQLGRPDGDGFVFGALGIIEGRGDKLCRLKNIEATEAVSPGDHVYTTHRNELLPYPMYYGKVVKAELKPGEFFWEILVEPAFNRPELQTVQILTTRPNPTRGLGN